MLTDEESVRTYLGPADRADGVECVVMPAGKRLDMEQGTRLVVAGEITVIRHRPARLDGMTVPGWTEIRVSERRHKRTGRELSRPVASSTRGSRPSLW